MLIRAFAEHIIPILAAGIAAAGRGFLLAVLIIPKTFVSEAVLYVRDTGDTDGTRGLAETCRSVIYSDHVLDALGDSSGNVYTRETLGKMIKTGATSNPRELRVSVEAGSARESYELADELVKLSVSAITRIIGEDTVGTVRAPTYPETHSFPDTALFTVAAAAAGLVTVYIIFLVREVTDTRLRPGDDIPEMYGLPELARIPDFWTSEDNNGGIGGS